MPIVYLKGDATVPQAKGPKIIAHICNDRGGWGKGFVLALSKRWSAPEQYYRRWSASKEGFELGAVQVVEVVDNLWVANMVAQRGFKAGSNGIPLQYPALDACLEKLALKAEDRKASIHMPRIGCGLAGGRWEQVEPLIQAALENCSVFVYDYEG
jgi:O-acetyl-ADP-ribose deacetylase (regulator of RNase III)